MPHRRRHLPEDSAIAAGTGRTLEGWAELLKKKASSFNSANELAIYLIDEFHLPIYWAHGIAYKLALSEKDANGKDRAPSDCLTPRLGV